LPADVPVAIGQNPVTGRETIALSALRATEAGAGQARAHAAIGPDTIAKFLFTSGSTKLPKAVVNTHRMWCSNLQMIRQCFPLLADQPPVLVDWLPWNHTFGGNRNIGITLYNGGSLYLDAGKPTPSGIVETVRNLRELAPTMYFNVPKGFEELCRAMDRDTIGLLVFPRIDDLRRHFELPKSMPAGEVLAHARMRAMFQALADRMWREGTGSVTRPARWMVMSEPPSIDCGKVTDKNSINQRAVLAARAALVEQLYADPPPPAVFVPAGAR